jgi:pyruvate dehydrogenase E1 component beta subunit
MAETQPQAITLIEAITQALAYEMRNDATVVVLGEDVGVNGGVFRATAGLQATFGSQRVLDTPLDETTIAGLTVGLASQGMKPVAEAQFDGFVYPMVDHIICHAARFRYRTRGRLTVPDGPARAVGRWHPRAGTPFRSERSDLHQRAGPARRAALSPARAYGLLLAAIRDPDPVIFMEPKRIYRQYKEHVPDDGEALPLDVCYVLRDGTDVTLVTWGAQVKECLEAAEALAKDGISAEVIDVADAAPARLRHHRRIGEPHRPLRDRARSPEDRGLRRRDRRAPGRGVDVRPRRAGRTRDRLRHPHSAVPPRDEVPAERGQDRRRREARGRTQLRTPPE